MILKLIGVAIAAQSQFWADSLDIAREMEKVKEIATQVRTVCGVVEIRLPNQVPIVDLQCDMEQGDN